MHLHVYPIKKFSVILLQIVMGRVVQTWTKITQGKCKIWIQIWNCSKSKFCLILSVNRVNDWMLLKITEKIIWENALNKRKRNSGLNLTLGYALSRPSNNSSCKKSWVPLQNQWATVKIKVRNWKHLRRSCNQTVNLKDRRQNSTVYWN